MTALLLLALVPFANAQEDTAVAPPIVSGLQVGADRYDDAVAILTGGEYTCSGALVGPRTVVTTALCAPEATHVIVGSKDWASSQGELLPIASYRIHELYFNEGKDIAVLSLTRASAFEPRAIADGCAVTGIQEGAAVTAAGFGALRAEEVDPNTRLNASAGLIISTDCEDDGCDPIPQAAEIIAGGEGVGPCVGDDGSPLYMVTEQGEVLIGLSSRAADSATQLCGDPSIYTRVDAYKQWIEDAAEDELAFPLCDGAPSLEVQPFDPIGSGGSGRTSFTVTDSDDSEGHTFFFSAPPEHGEVDILVGNVLRYRADRDFTGPDSFTLKVTDPSGNEALATVEVEVVRKGVLGCGCQSGTTGASWLLIGGAALLAGRRRHAKFV